MQQNHNADPSLLRPRVTVASVIEKDGRFLVVEERSKTGEIVINQPAGHVEHGETLLQAVARETFEETAWQFAPEYIIGVYLWAPPNGQASYLRFCFGGSADNYQAETALDDVILRAFWLSRDELLAQNLRLRSPLVLGAIDDYLSGARYPLGILKSFLPSSTL